METNSEKVPLMDQDGKADIPANESKKEENTFLGIHLKKDATRWNLFAIFYVFFLMTSIGGYINVQIVYLLRDTRYFDMEEDY